MLLRPSCSVQCLPDPSPSTVGVVSRSSAAPCCLQSCCVGSSCTVRAPSVIASRIVPGSLCTATIVATNSKRRADGAHAARSNPLGASQQVGTFDQGTNSTPFLNGHAHCQTTNSSRRGQEIAVCQTSRQAAAHTNDGNRSNWQRLHCLCAHHSAPLVLDLAQTHTQIPDPFALLVCVASGGPAPLVMMGVQGGGGCGLHRMHSERTGRISQGVDPFPSSRVYRCSTTRRRAARRLSVRYHLSKRGMAGPPLSKIEEKQPWSL